MDIKDLRNKIDTIDTQLVRLFAERMSISAQVAEYKRQNNLPIYVPEREADILMTVAQKAGPEMEEYAKCLYTLIFQLSRDYQEHKMETSREFK